MANTSNAIRTAFLQLYFQNIDTGWNNLGDATGIQASATAGTIQLACHTADPGLGGSQTTNECTYTGYTRITLNRDNTDWGVTGNAATNNVAATFPTNTGSTEVITHLSVGFTTGDTIGFVTALNDPLTIPNGNNPNFPIGNIDFTMT